MTKSAVGKKLKYFKKKKAAKRKNAQKQWAIGVKENEVLDKQFYKIFGD